MSIDQRSYEEKRDFIRVPVNCEVQLEDCDSGKRFVGFGKNLSANGVLFQTDERLYPGDKLEMHIESSHRLLSVLDATIEVVRVVPTEEGFGYSVGSAIRDIHE